MKIKTIGSEKMVLVDKQLFVLIICLFFIGMSFVLFYKTEVIIGLAFFSMGLLSVLIYDRRKVYIDKATRNIRVERKSFLSKTISLFAFEDITQVQNIQSRTGVGNPTMHQIGLLLKDGSIIPLQTPESVKVGIDISHNTRIKQGATIANFIGVPFQDAGLQGLPHRLHQ